MKSPKTHAQHQSCRSTSWRLGLVLLTLVWIGPAAVAAASDLADSWKIEKFSESETLVENRQLKIVNRLGDVRTRLSSDDQVVVSAVIQRHQDDPHEADIRIDPDAAGRMTIEAVFAASQSFDPEILSEEMKKRRIDLTVLVPLGARLEVLTDKGLIEAKGLESDISATSTSGNIVVSILGSLQARTERGEITATFKKTVWSTAPKLETLTGDIAVWLPRDADATIHAETRGLLTTDYSIEVTSDSRGDRKSATAVIGDGTHQLSIHSTKGNASILRQRG